MTQFSSTGSAQIGINRQSRKIDHRFEKVGKKKEIYKYAQICRYKNAIEKTSKMFLDSHKHMHVM